MLEALNRYAHGFVSIPVILACRDKGLFAALRSRSMSVELLVAELGANEGHLRAALRLLQSLGWIALDQDRCSLTADADSEPDVPGDIVSLLQLPIENYFAGQGPKGLLAPWIERAQKRWGTRSPRVADLIDGVLAVRVLTALEKCGALKARSAEALARVDSGARDELGRLFEVWGWATHDASGPRLTEFGAFMIDRAMIVGTLSAYTPMLSRMPELLFGDAARVFDRHASGQERHVDRTLNVAASGFQHDRFFAEVDAMLAETFDRLPLETQPKYVADMGCGDGTFLRRVYETVRTRTARGKALAEHPLTLIGIDFNEAALEATERTLAGLPHVLLKGDIGDPEALLAAFRATNVDPEAVLHIRSFLDHDRPFVPGSAEEASRRERLGHRGVYVDSEGRAIPPHVMMQALTEHFARWSKVVNRHGLVVLEVHNLEPRIANAYFDSTESLHFDAYHAFSMQYLVEAADFVAAAAEAGLFPRAGSSRRYPKTLPFSRITLNWFERRDYAVRVAHPDDLDALVDLERAWAAQPLQATRAALRSRMEREPLGQLVLEKDGRLLAAVYSQRVANVGRLQSARYEDVPQLREEDGAVVQLISLVVHPEFQGLGLADALLELVLQRAELLPGVETVAGISRCKDWRRDDGVPFAEYIHATDANGDARDPVLRFHTRHGARVTSVVHDYRPADVDNEGCGVLIQYDLASRRAGLRKLGAPVSTLVGGRVTSVVEASLREVLGPRRAAAFTPNVALRDMGLDSLDLTELKSLLGRRLGLELDPTLFFRYRTPEALAAYLESRVTTEGPLAPSTRVPSESISPRVNPTRPAPRSSPTRRSSVNGPIAIVGLACRFASANSADEYWNLLRDGAHAIRQSPVNRPGWSRTPVDDPDPSVAAAVRFGGFLDQVDGFDAAFFGISPREARSMDPQQRILLETTWHAFEDAGLDPRSLLASHTGVFVGISTHDYEVLHLLSGAAQAFDPHFTPGNLASVAAGRLAYFYGLHGPTLSVDTACSSSLVALHLASQSLRSGECDVALACGVNLILAREMSLAYARLHVLASDGRCKTFDASADGYVRGEGCGVVVLKRLEQAQADGDRILAVVRGTAINQDGPSNGLTAPNGDAQEAVIQQALASAGLSPADVDHVEAHGTGTVLGDPIEVSALGRVFGHDRTPEHPLVISSAKTAIGHMEAAAGIAGLIKVVLALQNERIPPHLHMRETNPLIRLDEIPAVIPTEGAEWPRREGRRRRAGVSSFGLSGTNAHAIVEEAPATVSETTSAPRPTNILCLSARTPAALESLAASYRDFLIARPDLSLTDVCSTASVGRASHEHRRAVMFEKRDELLGELGRPADRTIDGVAGAASPRIAFLFSGQGAQYAGMGRELLERESVFRAALHECDDILRDAHGVSILRALSGTGEVADLTETSVLQPALFAFEYALYRLWRSWGVEPDAVLGHSLGEYVAASVAGVLSLEDALRLVATRGRLMSGLAEKGVMVAVACDAPRAAAALAGSAADVSIAAINGPASVVLSGRPGAVSAAVRVLEAEGIRTKPLAVSNAFHSPLMDPILDTFEAEVGRLTLRTPDRLFVSNLLGRPVVDEVTRPDYWRRHLREAVRFADGVEHLLQTGHDAFVEIGPGTTLLGLGRLAASADDRVWLPSVRAGQPEGMTLLRSLATLYTRGTRIDWAGVHGGSPRRKVALPLYPFERKSYWFDDVPSLAAPATTAGKGVIVTEYYNAFTDVQSDAELRYLTFAPFPEVVPGFSWVVALSNPAANPEHFRILSEGQVQLRQTLFRHVDFSRCRHVQDIGCGYGSDLIDLGRRHPHLQLSGFSLSDRQVEVATARAREDGLGERVRFVKKDSARDDFPAENDVIFGFEVAHHVKDKDALFSNIGRHLREDGHLLLADFISEAAFPIEHTSTSSFFPTRAQWVDLLSDHGLVVAECVDVSQEVSNCLFDPQFDANLAAVLRINPDDNIRAAFRSYDQLGRLLSKGLARYVLLTAQKRAGTTLQERRHLNGEALARLTPYSQVSLAGGCYELAWREKALISEARAQAHGRWLVLADRQGLGEALADRLHASNRECECAPSSAPLPAAIRQRVVDGVYAGVIHAGSLDAPLVRELTAAGVAESLTIAAGVVDLVAAMAASSGPTRPRLWLVTRGAQPAGEGDIEIAQSPVLGLAKTLVLEHPDLWGGSVDVEPGAVESQVDAVLAELLATDGEWHVAYRRGKRLVSRLARRRRPIEQRPPIRSDASYLIAGGLGALGLRTARWLAAHGARHLVLVGRRAPDADAQDILRALERDGVSVKTVAADIARLDQVQSLVRDLAASMPPLRGIVNAAGIVDDGVLAQQTAERLRNVAAPKIEGSFNLHQATSGLALDFFVGFSSVAAMLGSAGQATYAAANAFMDALAHHRRRAGAAGLSVNWGPWASAGMAARLTASQSQRWAERGMGEIEPDLGLAVLGDLMAEGTPQAGVFPISWQRYLDASSPHRVPPFFDEVRPRREGADTAASGSVRSRLQETPPAGRREVLSDYVRMQVAKVLGTYSASAVDPRKGLWEMGLDSLLALELRNRLDQELGCRLPVTLTMNRPTVEAIVDHLGRELRLWPTSAPTAPHEATLPAPLVSAESLAVEELSESETEALLVRRLEEMEY